MDEKKFDPKKLQKLNNPQRLIDISPAFIWDTLKIVNPTVFVEIGAGTGFFSVPFLQYLQHGKIYACDISDIMIDWMKKNVCIAHPEIIPVKMEENAVPLEAGIADLVYMINLHHELDDPKKILQETQRLLKPNGTIFIVDWKKEDMPEGPPTHIRCSSVQVKDELEGAHFKNVRTFDDMAKHFLVIANN